MPESGRDGGAAVPEAMVGTWRLAGYRLTDAEGRQSEPWGDDARGYILYSADGYMSCSVERGDGAGGRDHLSYCGRLECLEGVNLHRIELSGDPALRGSVQRRAVRLDGDRMTLTAEPSIAYGPGSRAEILWRRVG